MDHVDTSTSLNDKWTGKSMQGNRPVTVHGDPPPRRHRDRQPATRTPLKHRDGHARTVVDSGAGQGQDTSKVKGPGRTAVQVADSHHDYSQYLLHGNLKQPEVTVQVIHRLANGSVSPGPSVARMRRTCALPRVDA